MAQKRFYTIVSILLLAANMLVFTSCEKYVTPGKVERKLTKGNWKITLFTHVGESIEGQFATVQLGFGEEGSMTVLNSGGAKGNWELSTNKNPTILYITGLVDEPYFFLNDNWEVMTCKKDKMTLKADHGNVVNYLTIIKTNED